MENTNYHIVQHGKNYVVTVVSAPCAVLAVMDDGRRVNLVTADKAGQYPFVAISAGVEIDQEDAILTRSFDGASLGLSAKGGVDEFYITVDADGTRRVHNNDKLVNGSRLFYFADKIDTSVPLVFSECLDASYMFQQSGVKSQTISVSLPKCTSVYAGFQLCNYVSVTLDAPKVKSCSWVFQSAGSIEHIMVNMSSCESISNFFAGTKVVEFVGNLPLLMTANEFAIGNPLLEKIDITTGLVSRADGFARDNAKLVHVPTNWPVLSTAKGAFTNCSLSGETINAILESLPRYASGTHIITFTGCPGAAACNPEIGRAKGWTVEI